MASLSDLPVELVDNIVLYLSQPGLYSVIRVNKGLYTSVVPILYRHVDLFIPPGNALPRIDRFCLAIITDSRKTRQVESVRLGLCPIEGVQGGQRWLPPDKNFDDQSMLEKAVDVLRQEMRREPLVATANYLRHAIVMREYSSYAVLILLLLPSLRRLDVADEKSATLDYLHTILRNMDSATIWSHHHPAHVLIDRLSSITHVSLLFDRHSGVAYSHENSYASVDHFINIPNITTLELSISGSAESQLNAHYVPNPIVTRVRPTNITTLVFRHSGPFLGVQRSLLESTPQLRSFTYDIFYDSSGREREDARLIDLTGWSDVLQPLRTTLEVLVFSAEYCDTSKYFFNQPRIGDRVYGYLDLTNFSCLHTLESPFVFLTGETELSITTEIYALLPPNLRHLSLRPDLSYAQAPFAFDLSILPSALTFTESKTEAQYLMNARMDVSYMFQASLTLLDQTASLETIAVWQPADKSLEWFDGQVKEFASKCRNKNVTAKILVPMLLRWKKLEHWDLVREITIFDRLEPADGEVKRFFRHRWGERPLGLASQYHLNALRSHQVKL
ncbi:hypothetical protein BDW02DRAFT_525059 [Decorospora gaudefroyi]|uniref:F-box domain-containing protein n=1 Tax=Decorospora gaudefroyi TaxID=184978 RepID=A0A6A5KG81_9PLEO|nr:hypothetical protein BDW02DRAFT_525059 [Decorospora gaudefroyi]